MAIGLDGCLAVYPPDEFNRVREKLQAARERGPRERQAVRAFAAGAADATPDKQGRVAIPTHLREYAALDREVIVAGGFDHIEIWDAQRFREVEGEGAAALSSGAVDDFGL